MIQLKPCPWNCGGAVQVESTIPQVPYYQKNNIRVFYVVHQCKFCRGRELMTIDFETKEEAIIAWNTRMEVI
jgi:C4-type Zn-finger protein